MSKRLEEGELRELQARVLEMIDAAVVATDADGIITYFNPGAERMHGWAAEEVLGMPISEVLIPEAERARILDEFAAGDGWTGDVTVQARDGSRLDVHLMLRSLRDDDGTLRGHVGVGVDMTSRVEVEQSLRGARDYLRAVTENVADGLFAINADGRVTMMNPAAEQMLGWTAEGLFGQSIHAAIHARRPDGTPYPESDCPIVSSANAQHTVRVDDDVFWRRDGTPLPVSYSVAPFTTEAGDRGRIVLFSDISATKAREQRLRRDVDALDWVGRIREALARESFVLYAQPIADLATGRFNRHELLLRMIDDLGALVPPGRFLPHAERYGLIREIDRWVIKRAADVAAAGHQVQVNLSAASLGDPEVFGFISSQIAAADAAPGNLTFELTETGLLRNEETAHDLITALKALGCGIALDDFGTGYGGFTYLKSLPVDFLKIDVEFVRDLLRNPASEHVVSAIVNLARGFGLRTIAEGVEDESARQRLREMGVDEVQGFAVGAPTRIDDEWLTQTGVTVQ